MARISMASGGHGTDILGDSGGLAPYINNLKNAGNTIRDTIGSWFTAGSSSPSTNTNPYGGNGGGGGSNGGGYSGSWSGGSASWSIPGTGYDLDLSAFDQARQAMIDSANRSKGILKQRYDNLLAELANRRKEGNQAFGAGRASITEDAYDRSRANMNDLASRGLSGSGLQQLGEVQERMETGQQMNDLASQYYSYLDDLEAQRAQGEQTYNEGLASIESSLEQQLANIGLQQFQAQDDYNRYMSDLAMQIASLTGPSYSYGRGGSKGYGDSSNELEENAIANQRNLDGLRTMFEAGIIDLDTYNAGVQSIMLDDLANADKYVGYYKNAPLSSTEADANANTGGNSFWGDVWNGLGAVGNGLGTLGSGIVNVGGDVLGQLGQLGGNIVSGLGTVGSNIYNDAFISEDRRPDRLRNR